MAIEHQDTGVFAQVRRDNNMVRLTDSGIDIAERLLILVFTLERLVRALKLPQCRTAEGSYMLLTQLRGRQFRKAALSKEEDSLRRPPI